MVFIHRFGSSVNEPMHFHLSVVDGVFDQWRATRCGLANLMSKLMFLKGPLASGLLMHRWVSVVFGATTLNKLPQGQTSFADWWAVRIDGPV